MTNILKKGIIILGIYLIFVLYLFYASKRIEILDKTQKENTIPVAVNISR